MWLWLALATVPVGIAGIALRGLIERAAGEVRVAGVGLLVTAALLLIGERARIARICAEIAGAQVVGRKQRRAAGHVDHQIGAKAVRG